MRILRFVIVSSAGRVYPRPCGGRTQPTRRLPQKPVRWCRLSLEAGADNAGSAAAAESIGYTGAPMRNHAATMPGRSEPRFRPRFAARPVERLAAALLALLAAFAAAAQRPAERIEESEPIRVDSPRRELLNSERIERRFGSYGIDVLESGGRYRVSNLYSVHDGAKVGRTYAVVAYPARIDPSIRAEHEEILAGGSIGAVFARNGWTVEKTHLYFGELPATTKVAALMRADEGAPLAVHV